MKENERKIRVLWFSPTSAGFCSGAASHNGGGWIHSLKELLINQGSVELGCVFEGSGKWNSEYDGVRLFPVQTGSVLKNRIRKKLCPGKEAEFLLPELKKAIDDFNPDLIHIWGSETALFSICRNTKIPCITHIQGFLPSYLNAKYPPGLESCTFEKQFRHHILNRIKYRYFEKVFANRSVQEAENFRYCKYFMGRTQWDRAIVDVYHPEAEYFHCDELLRKPFYTGKWQPSGKRDDFILTSVISSPTYKGQDMVLKTARLLKEHTNIPFRWNIYGIGDLDFWEKKLKINASENHVRCCGTVSAEELKAVLLDTDLYIHPSYIDNSPNSVCEAQILGVPVIATNVGGVSSLICHGEDGFLVPANDPVMMVSRIKQLLSSNESRICMGEKAAERAHKRHDPETVRQRLLEIYRSVLQKENR